MKSKNDEQENTIKKKDEEILKLKAQRKDQAPNNENIPNPDPRDLNIDQNVVATVDQNVQEKPKTIVEELPAHNNGRLLVYACPDLNAFMHFKRLCLTCQALRIHGYAYHDSMQRTKDGLMAVGVCGVTISLGVLMEKAAKIPKCCKNI